MGPEYIRTQMNNLFAEKIHIQVYSIENEWNTIYV